MVLWLRNRSQRKTALPGTHPSTSLRNNTFKLSLRRSKATVATLGRVAATRKGSRKDVVVYTPRKTTLPGVCSSVEAGEVARVAWRRGGDLPRGLRFAQNDRYSKYE